jgi:hypothetical protein
MSESSNSATIKALVAAINGRDLEIYNRFPSLPKATLRRLTGSGDVWVLEASLDYGDGDPYQAVFILEMRDGLIAKETAYWTKPFPAPEWRASWAERM